MANDPMTLDEQNEEAMGTKSTEKRQLWCVAAEEWDPVAKQWDLILRYNHAETELHARVTYCYARKDLPFRIVAIGPTIGFKVDDNQGLILSA